jgi:DNA-binding beta-propeller fold protein YncE
MNEESEMPTHLLKLLVLGGTAMLSVAAADPLYTLEDATVLPSGDTDWDYIRFDPASGRLFIARRKDGLSVFDARTHKLIGQVADSVGANGPLLLPQFDRGYVAMTDGSLLSFELKSLKVIERRKLAHDGGLNGVVYDPKTKRIYAVVGARAAQSAWFVLDAATGKLIERRVFPFRKMDDPAPDGKGHLFAPARYDNLLLRLDATTLAEQARWKVACDQVVAVEYHAPSDRILVGCRGQTPVFLALDPTTGAEVARLPIGKGIDGMVVDDARGRIVTSNGGDSSLSVIERRGPNDYRLLGNVQTRPQARVMAIDPASGRLFTVTADATFPAAPAGPSAAPPVFHANSFTVLTYKPAE